MAAIKIDRFRGIAPLHNPKTLPPDRATHALNVRFENGELRPYPQADLLESRQGSSLYLLTSIYERPGDNTLFVSRGLASFVEGFNPNETDRDLLFTSTHPGYYPARIKRDHIPASTLVEVSAGLAKLSASETIQNPLPLGVPYPEQAPQAMASDAPGGNLVFVGTENQAEVETSEAHGLSTGDRVTFTDTGQTDLDGGEFTVRKLSDVRFQLTGHDRSELAAVSNRGQWRQVYRDDQLEDRVYVYTYVTEDGEESAPSPVSGVVQVGYNQSVTLNIPGVSVASLYYEDKTLIPHAVSVPAIRLYRSVTGNQTAFFFVKEYNNKTGLTSLLDDVDFNALGEQLPTEDWYPPSSEMAHLTALGNGMLAGARGNEVCFCEPYVPYAWPRRYRRKVRSDIIAMAASGQYLVVFTRDKVLVGYGADPQSFDFTEVQGAPACAAPGTVATSPSGVFYVSKRGLHIVSNGTVRNLTEELFTPDQWEKVVHTPQVPVPQAFGAFVSDTYFLQVGEDVLAGGWGQMLSFQFSPTGLECSWFNAAQSFDGISYDGLVPRAAAPGSDNTTLLLIQAKQSSSTPMQIVRQKVGSSMLEPGETSGRRSYEWVSKTFTFLRPVSLSVGQLFLNTHEDASSDYFAQADPGTTQGVQVRVRCLDDGREATAITPVDGSSDVRFRVAPMKGRSWEVSIYSGSAGSGVVEALHLASTVEELRAMADE